MPYILITDDGPIRTIRMNRPEKKNALTFAMYEAMSAAIEDAGGNATLRCLLIAGAPGAFCAGNDIGDFMQMTRERRARRADHALPLRAGALREAAGRRGRRRRGRHRHHHAAALRPCGRGQRRAAVDALRRARPGAGSGLQPDGAAADGAGARLLAAGDGSAALGLRGQGRRHRQYGGGGGANSTARRLPPRTPSPRCRRRRCEPRGG